MSYKELFGRANWVLQMVRGKHIRPPIRAEPGGYEHKPMI